MPIQNTTRAVNGPEAELATAVSVTAGAANVKSAAWATLVASTAYESSALVVHTGELSVTATDTSTLVDIAIGGAGSERVLIANMNAGGSPFATSDIFPVNVPAGTRISAKVASATASKVVPLSIAIVPASHLLDSGHVVDTYGAITGTSKGTTLTTVTSVNVRGAWTEIAASTTRPARWVTWSLGIAGTVVTGATGFLDIGFGAAASERVIAPNIYIQGDGTEKMTYGSYYVPCAIPVGSRLVARYAASSTVSTAAPNVCIHLIA